MLRQETLGLMKSNLRRWRTQAEFLNSTIKSRFLKAKKLTGSGRRPLSEDLEELVYQWVVTKMYKSNELQGKGSRNALQLYPLSREKVYSRPEKDGSKFHETLFAINEKKNNSISTFAG